MSSLVIDMLYLHCGWILGSEGERPLDCSQGMSGNSCSLPFLTQGVMKLGLKVER